MTAFRARFCLAVIVLMTVASACSGYSDFDVGDRIEGSGDAETRDYDLSGFDKLDISSAFVVDVRVVPQDAHVVTVTVDDNLFDELVIEVNGDTLEIGVRSGSRVRSDNPLAAEVWLPALSSVDASGASQVALDAARTEVSAFTASGASRIRAVDLDVGDVAIDASGASTLDLAGIGAERVDIEASGASRIDLSELPIDTAKVQVSGASTVEFGPTQDVAGDASGASTIRVEADTEVDVETSGGARVDRR